MKRTHHRPAKILIHDTGLGVPSLDLVRRRALELARLDGRSEHDERDWRQARLELHGGMNHSDNGEDEMIQSVSERDMIAGSLGHRVESTENSEPENVVEELIAEGMDEAVHEQMLESRRLQEELEA
jgi:hypothetical protein